MIVAQLAGKDSRRFYLITCQLTKLETALDQIKKAYPKLAPADAAIVASALSLTGRHALAVYEENTYAWPEDGEKLSKAMIPQMRIIQEAVDNAAPVKKTAKSTVEDEPIQVHVGLKPNYDAGEALLKGRDDLKTLLSDIVQEGVEFVYNPTDIGWQWALERVNWNTVADIESGRRIRVKTQFTEGATGVEQGTTIKKRTSRSKSVEEVEAPIEAIDLIDVV